MPVSDLREESVGSFLMNEIQLAAILCSSLAGRQGFSLREAVRKFMLMPSGLQEIWLVDSRRFLREGPVDVKSLAAIMRLWSLCVDKDISRHAIVSGFENLSWEYSHPWMERAERLLKESKEAEDSKG
jgi:hypothetical protein